MPQQDTALSKRPKIFAAAGRLIALTAAVVLAGCAAGYGRLEFSDDVARKIASGQVDPEYRYYIDGRTHLPYAIVGLHRNYELDSRLWIEITPGPEELRQLAAAVFPYAGNPAPNGAWLMDPHGNRIGVWYSQFEHSVVEMLPAGRVRIHSPYEPGGLRFDASDRSSSLTIDLAPGG